MFAGGYGKPGARAARQGASETIRGFFACREPCASGCALSVRAAERPALTRYLTAVKKHRPSRAPRTVPTTGGALILCPPDGPHHSNNFHPWSVLLSRARVWLC